MRTVNTLTRLGIYPNWSETLLYVSLCCFWHAVNHMIVYLSKVELKHIIFFVSRTAVFDIIIISTAVKVLYALKQVFYNIFRRR